MAERLIYFYILFLPLMNLPKPTFMGSKLQYADLIFIPLFLIYLIELFKGKVKLIRNKIDLSVILLLLVSFLSFLHSWSKKESFPDFLGLVYLISLYFVLNNLINEEYKFKKVIFLLFIVTLFISLSGIFFFILQSFFDIKWASNFLFLGHQKSALISSTRISSFFNLPEMFTNFVLLGLGCSFVYRESLYRGRKRLLSCCIILIIFSAFLTFSRSLVGIMLFLTMIAFHFKKVGFSSSLLLTFCLDCFILIFIFAIISSIFMVYPVSLTKDEANGIIHFSFNSNPDTRVYLTKSALAISRKHPVLGIGIGLFSTYFKEFLTDGQIKALSDIHQVQPSVLRIDPHSLYFGTISEMGLLGFAVLFLFFLFVIGKLIKVFKLANSPFLKNVCYIFLAAICGYLVNGFFVDILSMRSLWVLLSLGMVWANLAEQNEKKQEAR